MIPVLRIKGDIMKKIFLSIILLFLFSAFAHAGQFHLFFIAQQTADKPAEGYSCWVINSGGQEYYFAEHGVEMPEGYTVRRAYLLASSGANDMIYYFTRNAQAAQIGSVATEYAGGSKTTTSAAWVDFTFRSYEQVGIHSGFPAGAAARLVLNASWKEEGEWVFGTAGDWKTAGFPADSATVNIGMQILGAD